MATICTNCGQEFSRLRLGLQWPSSIKCRQCNTVHSYPYGSLIGLAFVVALLPACLAALVVGNHFTVVHGNTQSLGALQLIVQFGILSLAIVVYGLVQGSLLNRFGKLLGPKK